MKTNINIFSISYFLDGIQEKIENRTYKSKGEIEDDIIRIHEICKENDLPDNKMPPYIRDVERDLMMLRETFSISEVQ